MDPSKFCPPVQSFGCSEIESCSALWIGFRAALSRLSVMGGHYGASSRLLVPDGFLGDIALSRHRYGGTVLYRSSGSLGRARASSRQNLPSVTLSSLEVSMSSMGKVITSRKSRSARKRS